MQLFYLYIKFYFMIILFHIKKKRYKVFLHTKEIFTKMSKKSFNITPN